MDRAAKVAHWVASADRDFVTMQHLFESGDYAWALFVGHLVTEKLIKAYFIKQFDEEPPRWHNLVRLADRSLLDVTPETRMFLAQVTTFNLRGHYEDYRHDFYRTATKTFAAKWMADIGEFRTWIKPLL